MNLFANSIAVLLMVVVPYIRPCSCGDFTLFCHCDADARQAADVEARETPPEPKCPN
jgi:hypothetical protein